LFEMRESGKQLLAGRQVRGERKHIGEVLREARLDFGKRDAAGEKLFERRGFAVDDATRNDEVEMTQVGRNVVGQAMRSDPTADVHANGGKFLFAVASGYPDAGFARNAVSGDTEIGTGTDHGFFESANVPSDISLDIGEVQNGIADDLPGAMIGDISTPVRDLEFYSLLPQNVFGGEKIRSVGIAAEGDDMGVFAEKENVMDGPGLASSDDPLLQGKSVGVGDEAEVGNEARGHWSE